MTENEISKIIVHSSLKIHKKLGPGLMESTYEQCLAYELRKHGLQVEKQKALAIDYEELTIESAYRIDLLINEKVIIELKSVESVTNVHWLQLQSYLKLSNCKPGLLINFNVDLLKKGIHRITNGINDN